MNLRQLRYFVEIVDARNMTRAAERLNVAQPALGMQIKQLEDELGISLLSRHSRGTQPTSAGAVLYDRAVKILQLVEEAKQEVMASSDQRAEPLRLGITPSLMQIIGSELILKLSERAPRVSLSLSEEMSHLLVGALHRGELDMVLAYEVPDVAGYWKRALYQEDLVLVNASPQESDHEVSFAEALSQPLILPEPRDSVRALVERTAEDLGIRLQVAHEIRSIPGIKTMILRGVAAGILPLGTVLSEVQSGSLVMRPITGPKLRRTLYLAGSRAAGRMSSFHAIREVVAGSVDSLSAAMGKLGHPLAEARKTQHFS